MFDVDVRELFSLDIMTPKKKGNYSITGPLVWSNHSRLEFNLTWV